MKSPSETWDFPHGMAFRGLLRKKTRGGHSASKLQFGSLLCFLNLMLIRPGRPGRLSIKITTNE
jgi:hypothetical protein